MYLVDLEDRTYSLCLPLSSLKGEYTDFGQEAFNCYAVQAGEPVTDGRFYTHGDGHEWNEKEEKLKQITFDCEATGFFCNAESFELMEEYGKRFRKICMDEKIFTELVCKALSENRQLEDETVIEELTSFLSEVVAWQSKKDLKWKRQRREF